jgi:hypothetical protein
MPSGLAELSKGIQADPEDIEQVGERLRKMSGLQLRKFGRAAQLMADPDEESRHAQSDLLKHSPDSIPVVIPGVDVAMRPTRFFALDRIDGNGRKHRKVLGGSAVTTYRLALKKQLSSDLSSLRFNLQLRKINMRGMSS